MVENLPVFGYGLIYEFQMFSSSFKQTFKKARVNFQKANTESENRFLNLLDSFYFIVIVSSETEEQRSKSDVIVFQKCVFKGCVYSKVFLLKENSEF